MILRRMLLKLRKYFCWRINELLCLLFVLFPYVNQSRHHHSLLEKAKRLPILICSDMPAHIYKEDASCHLLYPSSFSTLFMPCGCRPSPLNLLRVVYLFQVTIAFPSSFLIFLLLFYAHPKFSTSCQSSARSKGIFDPSSFLQCLAIPLSLRLHSL